jgi:hypothetical protein
MTTIPEPAREPDPVHSNDWDPQKGETVAGVVAERETYTSRKSGREFDVLVVRNGDGEEKRVTCARSHLRQLLEENDPKPGDGIAVTYFGREEEGEFSRHLYAMRVTKADDDVPF